MAHNLEFVCKACGASALLRREPVYDGFRKVGVRAFCSRCGVPIDNEQADAIAVQVKPMTIFGDGDRNPTPAIFENEERGRNCRHCRRYVVNPFEQRCGLTFKNVAATDVCLRFEAAEPAPPAEAGAARQTGERKNV